MEQTKTEIKIEDQLLKKIEEFSYYGRKIIKRWKIYQENEVQDPLSLNGIYSTEDTFHSK